MTYGTVLERRPLLRLAVLLWTLAPTAGLAYEFRIIAQPGDVIDGRTITRFSSEDNPIAINNSREVVFMASVDGLYNWSIMTPDRFIAGGGKVVDGVVPRFEDEDHLLSINDAGQVAYRGIFDGSAGSPGAGAIFVNDEIVAGIGDVIDGRTITAVDFRPVINNEGTVAFVARYEGHDGDALFTQERLIAERGQVIDGSTVSSVFRTQIHDNGTIAFSSVIMGQNNVAIFTQDSVLVESGETLPWGGGFIVNDVIDGRIIAGDIKSFGISDSGEVAFWAIIASMEGAVLGQGLFTQDRLLVESGDVIDGQMVSTFRNGRQFNSSGTFSLLADIPGAGKGLWVADEFLIATGAIVNGRRVDDFHHIVGMNDRGDVAFLAHFEDGGSAIVMVAIPEPSTLMLFALGLVLLVCRRAVLDGA